MKEWMKLLTEGVTAYHTIEICKKTLLEEGFEALSLEQPWELKEGGKYVVDLYGTNFVAFSVGKQEMTPPIFRVAMAHSDYPCFRIKPQPVMNEKGVTKLNVELYGGMYQKSWLDRPLGVAGTIILKGEDAFSQKKLLYKSEKPICVIPSLAIHMDRELNKKGALDVAKELVPIAALSEQGNLLTEIAKQLCVKEEEIIDYDLFLYNTEQPQIVGLDDSMLLSARIDNLSSVAAILEGIMAAEPSNQVVNVMAVFDHEEVGSMSSQGADSELLKMMLEKIGTSLFGNAFLLTDVLKRSFLMSVDVAHGQHPNYEEKSDATNKAKLGNGFCIKRSMNQKYGTTAETSAILKQLCEEKQIPYTIAVNKTGIVGGSTLGPIATSHLPMPCVDLGMPILAMHSTCELAAKSDYNALKQIITGVYEYPCKNVLHK